MADKYVTIDVSPAGNVKVEAHNFAGVGCADATQQIEIAIGGMGADKKNKSPKPDYYEANSVDSTNHNVF